MKTEKHITNHKKRILFVEKCVDLVGGVERVICTLANEMSEEYDVSVLSEEKLTKKSFFDYDASVKKYYLFDKTDRSPLHNRTHHNPLAYRVHDFINRTIIATIRSIKMEKFLAEHGHFDVIIFGRTAVATHFLPIISKLNNRPRVIVRDAIHLYCIPQAEQRKMLKYFPDNVDTFIVSSDESLQEYKTFFNNETINITKIYNPLAIQPKDGCSPRHKTITSIGRIDDDQKGFSVLVPVMHEVNKKHPDWKLIIYGGGSNQTKIKRLLDQHNSNIELHEYTNNVVDVFQHTSIFAFPSRYEGYANTLVEALACGVPSVTFNWLCGAEEIIQNMQNGIIVELKNRIGYAKGKDNEEDVKNFAKNICFLIENEEKTASISKQATKITKNRNKDKIVKEWLKIIEAQ